ncbi:4Fe-4S binding protein [Slackia sp.]|uniref:4Fe-4S binding protein n=2 Tax=Slackia sp. TaxID=2049041 RepID=UPI00263045DA|nr:4Fe-4S binding protein [Slackia sp.]
MSANRGHDEQQRPGKTGRMKTSTKRTVVFVAVFVLVGVGLAFSTGTGTLSAIGVGQIAAICPLGALEAMFGAWAFLPRALLLFAGIALVAIVFGKAFCGWVCPVPHFQRFFTTKKAKAAEHDERVQAAKKSVVAWREGCEERTKPALDSRHAVLGATLLSAAVFGFPVFCLICPVGLTFATFILMWRFVQFNEPTIGLLVFPAILIVEFVVLRRWCHKICPLGALLSLLARGNKTFRPTVDRSLCLRCDGVACETCASVCPEHIDPYADAGERSMVECTKCKTCAQACPVSAIRFPLRPAAMRDASSQDRGEATLEKSDAASSENVSRPY